MEKVSSDRLHQRPQDGVQQSTWTPSRSFWCSQLLRAIAQPRSFSIFPIASKMFQSLCASFYKPTFSSFPPTGCVVGKSVTAKILNWNPILSMVRRPRTYFQVVEYEKHPKCASLTRVISCFLRVWWLGLSHGFYISLLLSCAVNYNRLLLLALAQLMPVQKGAWLIPAFEGAMGTPVAKFSQKPLPKFLE